MKHGLKTKKGVSLVVLIITIIVAIVLLSVSVVAVKNAVDNAALLAYAQDLSTLGEMTQEYYIKNEDYPKINGTEAMSQGAVLALAGAQSNALLEEMRLNNDIVANDAMGSYYQIDIAKLDIAKTTRGLKRDGAQDDVYVVCYPSENIYYVQGLKAKSKTYFSLSSQLTDVTKVEKKVNDTTYDVQTAAGMTAKKQKKSWTNRMGIDVQIVLEEGDELFVKAGMQEAKRINTYVGTRSYTINKLEDLKAVSDFTVKDDVAFDTLPQSQKKIEIIKMRNTVEKGKIVLDLSNYDTYDPYSLTAPVLTEGETENVVSFQVADKVSGIKEVRYEYIKKFNDQGMPDYYFQGIDTLDVNYMKTRAKRTTVNAQGNVEIKVPKDIEGIQILVLDKAGNGIVIKQNTASKVYIGIVPKEITLRKATFKLVFNSQYGVRNVATSISTDGKTYTNPVAVNGFQTTSIISSVDVDNYTNVDATNGVYVKVTAQDNSSGAGTVVKLLGKDGVGKLGTKDKYASTWENPYIPVGFEHLEGSVQDGFVIKDISANEQTDGNEFVWIPVKDINLFKLQTPSYNGKSIVWSDTTSVLVGSTTEVSLTKEMSNSYEYQKMYQSVARYGGFYIARYAAGKPDGVTTPATDGTVKPLSKAQKNKWEKIAWGTGVDPDNTTIAGDPQSNGAVKVSRSMYPDIEKAMAFQMPSNITSQTDVISTLCYGVQWDAMTRYLGDVTNVTVDQPYIISYAGMYENTTITGNSAVKNIFDLGGFAYWTMEYEAKGVSRICRGSWQSIAARDDYIPSMANVTTIGFRPTLYIN